MCLALVCAFVDPLMIGLLIWPISSPLFLCCMLYNDEEENDEEYQRLMEEYHFLNFFETYGEALPQV